ncbi:MAG: hypothetical protein GYB68_05250 [Chloroflexi bacterium]|nr:hypothetical protein [Chloroflexota bacterium]
MALANPHDALFRALLEDPKRAETLIREYLPVKIANLLTDEPPALVDGTFIDEELRGSQSDRLFEARLRNGRLALIYALLEHKSHPDASTPLQLLGYMVRIWKRHAGQDAQKLRALPPIIPLVFYHGKEKWEVPNSIIDCIDADDEMADQTREFRYILHNLQPIAYEQLSSYPPLRAVLGALKFAFVDGVGVEALAAILKDLPNGDPLELQVLVYIVTVYNHATQDALTQALSAAKPGREEELMPTIAQEWLKQGKNEGKLEGLAEGKLEGLAEGKLEGLAEGKLEGLAEGFLDVLEARFGAVSPQQRAQIATMSSDEVHRLIKQAATAPSLDAVFDPALRH